MKRFANIELENMQCVLSKANIKIKLLINTIRDELFQLLNEFITIYSSNELVGSNKK